MTYQLVGRLILIVEYETPIALALAYALQRAGAGVVTSDTAQLALEFIEADIWAAAVLGPTQSMAGDCRLCERLQQRGIPFLLRAGSSLAADPCCKAPRLHESEDPDVFVQMVERLVRGRSILN